MLKVTYENLRDHAFARGMSKLANFSGFKKPAVAYNVAKINLKCMEEAKIADDLFKNLVKKYAKLDDKGEIQPMAGQPGTFEIRDEAVPEWQAALKEFLAHEVEINRERIKFDDVGDAGLSPMEIGALESILLVVEAAAG